jgi:hypothetical protein
MSMLSSGYLGIGVSAPTEKLVVHAAIRSTGSASDFAAGATGVSIDFSGGVGRIGTVTGASASTGDVAFLGNNAERMRMTAAGLFGIGQTPTKPFQVYANGGLQFAVHQDISSPNAHYMMEGGSSLAYLCAQGATNTVAAYSTTGTGAHIWYQNGNTNTEKMRIDSSGKFSVGATSGSGRLNSTAASWSENALTLHSATTGGGQADFCGIQFTTAGVGSADIYTNEAHDLSLTATSLSLKTGSAGISGGTAQLIIDSNGHVTAPNQSSFYASCAALANKTGNQETTYLVGSSGYTWTEVQDRNADFNGAGLFTAPVSGFYHMSGTQQWSGLNSATSGVAYLIVSNGNIQILHNPTNIANVSVNYNINISQVVYMDANDTAQLAMYINGAGSAVCDLNSAQFSGYLLG